MKIIDMTGRTFGRLTVLRIARDTSPVTWWCQCSCGNQKAIDGKSLRFGLTQSCGCLRSEASAERARERTTHGASIGGKPSHEYKVWQGMKDRCTNPHATGFKYYGGRGIRFCKRWESFENFLADMGPCPEGRQGHRPKYTLDRKDNDGDYKPSNCRWVTHHEQANNRRCTTMITNGGVTKALGIWWNEPIHIGNEMRLMSEWAHAMGLSWRLVQLRASRGRTSLLELLAPHRSFRPRARG
jgi:hypothetical protein